MHQKRKIWPFGLKNRLQTGGGTAGMHQKRKIWPFGLKNRLQTGGGTAGRRVPGAVQTSPPPDGGDPSVSGPRTKRAAKKRKIWPFGLKNRLQTGGGTAGRRVPGAVQTSPPRTAAIPASLARERSAPRRNEKSGLLASKIDYRQVAGLRNASKQKIWPFGLKNRLQTGGRTAGQPCSGCSTNLPRPRTAAIPASLARERSAPRRNEKSGLLASKIGYRQVARLRNASKQKIWPFGLKNRLQTGGGTAGRRVPGAVQTSPPPARRRSRRLWPANEARREETRNLASWPQKSATDRWRDGRTPCSRCSTNLPPRTAAIPASLARERSAPRRNEKSGLLASKIGYRQVAGQPDSRVPGAVQTSPAPARRRSRRLWPANEARREETRNLAFWPQKSTTDRWRDSGMHQKRKIWPFVSEI